MHVCVCVRMCVYDRVKTYIYIYKHKRFGRDRDRERERDKEGEKGLLYLHEYLFL